MLLTVFYDFFLPKASAFVNSFDNEAQRKAAQTFVRSLDNCEMWLLISCIFIPAILCVIYYKPYNDTCKPWGYHYRVSHWLGWLILAEICVGIATYLLFNGLLKSNLAGTGEYLTDYIIANSIYCGFIFLVVSVIWCNCLPTNAYRWFKFRR